MYKNILVLPDGTEIKSGAGTQNAIKSVKITELVNSGTDLIIGSCCCDMLEASLFTPGGDLDITAGDEVAVYKEDAAGKRVKIGAFVVESPTRPTANTMKITGYDRVSKLDKDLTAWVNSLADWPYSVNEFAAMTCKICGLTFVPTSGLPNADFPIRKWSKSGVTGRQIMRWLGEISCRFVHADPDGNIRFGWYTDSGKTFTPAGNTYYFAGSFSYENYQVAPVDIVQLRLADSEFGAAWPAAQEGDNPYIISGNAILTAYVTDDLIPYLEAIQAELSGISYTPCEISAPVDPSVRAGSILTATDRNGKRIRAYVMEKTSTGQRDTYRCTGNPRRDSSSSLYNKTESDKSADAAMNAAAGLNQQAIFDKLTNNGEDQGLFLKDGKVYINAEYLMAGSFTTTAEVFLDPGFEEVQTIKNHILGVITIPTEYFAKYDFNSDGDVTITDLLIAQKCALGQQTLKEWTGAVKTEVTVTIDSSNAEKVVWIHGTNMWGRAVEYYIGFSGANIGRVLGDLIVSGALTVGGALRIEDKLFAGSGLLVDEIPEDLEEGRLVLKKVVI